MASALVEDATNADFGTGPTYPDNGDSGSVWWGVQKAAIQQLADRTQFLAGMVGGSTPDAPLYFVPLNATLNTSSRFGVDGSGLVWTQGSVASAGELYFPVGGLLPVGRKITAVTATINGASDGTLPATMPTLRLEYIDLTGVPSGGVIGSVTDPTATNADFTTDAHDFSITGLSHTINANYSYAVKFTGVASTHSATGLNLYRIFLTLGY